MFKPHLTNTFAYQIINIIKDNYKVKMKKLVIALVATFFLSSCYFYAPTAQIQERENNNNELVATEAEIAVENS